MFFLIASIALGITAYSIWLELEEQRELVREHQDIIARLTIDQLNNDAPPASNPESLYPEVYPPVPPYQDSVSGSSSYIDGSEFSFDKVQYP